MLHESYINDSLALVENLTPDMISPFLWDTTRHSDCQRFLIGGTAYFTKAQYSLSVGISNTQYIGGDNYQSETPVFPGNFLYQRASSNFNISLYSLNFNLQSSCFYYSRYNRNFISDLTINNRNFSSAPNAPYIYNSDGKLNWAYNLAAIQLG